jgi:glycosyltransferase involved in cell wall biosynthesis
MKDKLKILMYGWEFPPYISGGLGVACHGIVAGLAKQDAEISLILPKAFSDITQKNQLTIFGCDLSKELPLNIDIHKIDALLHPYLNENSYQQALIMAAKLAKQQAITVTEQAAPITGEYGSNLITEVLRYAVLAGGMAATLPHDIIHAHDWLTILAGVVAKQFSGKPLIFQIHALETDRSGENVNREIFNIEKYGMEKADKIIAVSEYTKAMIIKYYGISAKKIVVVHNGIFAPTPEELITQRTKKRSKRKMVLFVGRVTHQKGPWFFMQTAKKILTKRKDVHFVIAGSGDQLKDMINLAAEYRIGSRIHFMGFLSQKMVEKLYQLTDVYVMPSVSEPFGLSCLEALSHNIPVVISKQSGVAEVLGNVLKSDHWDIDDMAAKILALLEYRALARQTVTSSCRDVSRLTWDKTANNLINLYEEVINHEKK